MDVLFAANSLDKKDTWITIWGHIVGKRHMDVLFAAEGSVASIIWIDIRELILERSHMDVMSVVEDVHLPRLLHIT